MNEDIIGHLIQIEHDAASILLDAQMEADKRTADARLYADADYKKQYEKLIQELEEEYTLEIDSISKEHNATFDSFKNDLQKTKKDLSGFNVLMEKLLFEA